MCWLDQCQFYKTRVNFQLLPEYGIEMEGVNVKDDVVCPKPFQFLLRLRLFPVPF